MNDMLILGYIVIRMAVYNVVYISLWFFLSTKALLDQKLLWVHFPQVFICIEDDFNNSMPIRYWDYLYRSIGPTLILLFVKSEWNSLNALIS